MGESCSEDGRVLCPLRLSMEIIGGKWKSSIVCLLFDGRARRYSEIRHVMPEVTNAMLAQSLKELERDHIVTRMQYNEMPVRVEYRITEEGKTLITAFEALNQWGNAYLGRHPEHGNSLCGKCAFTSAGTADEGVKQDEHGE